MFSAVDFECSRAFGSVQLLVFAVFVFDFPNIPAVVLFFLAFRVFRRASWLGALGCNAPPCIESGNSGVHYE
jgi:hypothetical protein